MIKFLSKFYIIFSVFLGIFLSGCAKNLNCDFPEISFPVDKKIKMICGEKEYKCSLFYAPEGICTVKFMEPKELENFTICRKDGKYEISHNDLQTNFTKNPVIDSSSVIKIMEFFDIINSENNDLKYQNMEESEKIYTNSNYEARFDRGNNLVSVSIKKPEITIEFER